MQSNEYDVEYFRKTRKNAGLLLKKMRPLWWRWVKIIRKYKPSGRLLDIGCGEGYFLEYAERHYEIYGMDVSEYCIHEAKHRTTKGKLSVGGIADIDYDGDSFDIITGFDVLEHLENPDAAIRECRRILQKRGLFVIRVPNTSSFGYKWKKERWFGHKDKTHISLLSNKEWFDLISENGFEISEVFYDGLWDTPYFENIPKFLQDMLIKFPSLILFFIGLKFRVIYGENLCIIAIKSD